MSAAPVPQSPRSRPPVPPLRNGDRLTRSEFERRYAASPNVRKAELIEGVVFMPSPVRYQSHSNPHWILATWLGYYASKTPGLSGGDNGTVRLDIDNEPQPDLFLLLPPHAGGLAKIDDDDYVSGPPALICEIASSSVSIDLHHKKNAYRRNGVPEYLVWRVEEGALDWFNLINGDYVAQAAETPDGVLKSRQFPGLWLDVPALLRGDLPALFASVDRGVATTDHAEFLKRLKK